jgi:hypothetical protein
MHKGAPMRLHWRFLFFVIPLVQGCVTNFPQESDIAGTWEGIGLAYVLFEYQGSDEAHIVAGSINEDGEEFTVGRLSDFVSREDDFTLVFTADVDGETTSEVLRGQVYGSRILLRFADESEDEEMTAVWLIRSSELDASRAAARNALNVYLGAEK